MTQTRKIITNPDEIRDRIHTKVKAALQRKFPIRGQSLTADIRDVRIEHKPMSHNRQKKILMGKGNASDAVYCTLEIKDNATGEVIQTINKHRLMNIPYFTDRYSFIVEGNEYNVVNQLRTKSGVYTRKRGNDELESSFNLQSGANFKLIMDPDTGKFSMDILHSKLPLIPVLRILGASTAELQKSLGRELYDKNKATTASQKQRVTDTLYKKLVQYKSGLGETASAAEKEQAIRAYFDGTKLDEETTRLTLGESHGKVGKRTLLQAVEKMLRVYKQEDDVDDRDNLEFQKVHGPEDIVGEVVEKSTQEIKKIKSKLDSFSFGSGIKPGTPEAEKKIKQIFSPSYFTRPVKNFVATSSISRLTDQINPLEIMQNSALVTRLGEGAIASEQAVPDETRSVNYSYMGTIDPVMSPESSKIGIDNHFAIDALKGDDNELYKEVRNTRTGQIEQVRMIDLYEKNVGFPDPKTLQDKDKKPSDKVNAVRRGEMVEVKRSELDYQIPDTTKLNSLSTNNIPFINANQGNRILMAAKHQTQAMPLKDRDTRLVEPMLDAKTDHSITNRLGDFLVPKAPADGTVTKISDDFIHVKDKDGNEHQVDYAQNLPLASKTMLHNNLSVSPGDQVKKGQALGDSNFSKDGKLALGKNLRVAYMPYKGYNHEDGIVISESASKKLTSMHSETIHIDLDKTVEVDKEKFVSTFPGKFTQAQLKKVGSNGVVKKGTELEEGDPLVLVLGDASENRVNQVLGKLHKSLMRNYNDQSEVYDEDVPGRVVDVQVTQRGITVMVAKEKKAKLGDKISGSYGNKGVATLIQPDDKMPQDEEGRPMDAVFTSAGIVSRINPAQVLETALGKAAEKRGKPYKVENYSQDSYVDFVRGELKKHGVKEKETLTDPETGRKIPGIFTGIQHAHKMHKTTDTNFSARGVLGGYDQDDAPVGSGTSGPKAIGGMEVNALLAHNARNFLKESTMLRGSRNQDFWNNYQYGGLPQFPKEKPTFNKFLSTLKQAGVNVEREGDRFVAAPLMDKDIEKMSSGEVKNARRVDSKNLKPEQGGLFDENVTGGLEGDRWSHINLAEPVVNPVFEDCVAALLGIPRKEVKTRLRNEGGDALRDELNKINVSSAISSLEKELDDPKLKGSALDKKVRKMQYLKALQQKGLKPGEAYMLTKFPVTPPKMRPISVGKTGDIMENDSNEFYKDLILTNDEFKETKNQKGFDEEKKNHRLALQEQVDAITGTIEPRTQSLKNKNAKGAVKFIAGDQPKRGFFQRKAVYNKMNLTGRATIAPDQTLGLDEMGMPVDMAWDMYRPFILRKLSEMGYSGVQAQEEVDNRSATAKKILEDEMENRPAVINRAPTLWKHSIIGAKPKLREGKNIGVNTLWEKGTNADFDGDSGLNSIIVRISKRGENDKSQDSGLTNLGKWLELKHGNNNFIKGDSMPFSDSAIRTVKGLINLEDFPRIEESKRIEGNIEKYDVPSNIEILSVMDGESAWLPVTEFSIHKNLEMKEVQTNSKRTIHCSSDDSLISVDENLDYCKVAPEHGLTIPRVTEPLTVKDPEQLLHSVSVGETEINLTRDMGWFSGAFIGDGWLDNGSNNPDYAVTGKKNTIMVCKDDPGFQDKWKSIIRFYDPEQRFTQVENRHQYEGRDSLSVKITTYNKLLRQYFYTYFGQTAAKKSLPYFWMETTEEFRWGLLAGLIDSDGSVSVVQAKSKKNPQINVSYTSISKPLIYEIAALADSLGLTATPYFARMTSAGNESWGVSFTTASIATLQHKLALYHTEKRDALASFKIKEASKDIAEQHQLTPRISSERLRELRATLRGKRIYKKKKKGETGPKELNVPENEVSYWKQVESIKTILARLLKKEAVMTRQTAKKIIAVGSPLFETSNFWKKWKAMVEDDSIVWEEIRSIRPIPEITEAYDITAPPNYTMVTESGFVVQDSMTVHLPVTDEAVNEVNNMLPSKMVFSDKKRNDLIMAPSMEPITGLYKATKNLGGSVGGDVKKFKSEADAWEAYHAGKLKMTDKVEIG